MRSGHCYWYTVLVDCMLFLVLKIICIFVVRYTSAGPYRTIRNNYRYISTLAVKLKAYALNMYNRLKFGHYLSGKLQISLLSKKDQSCY